MPAKKASISINLLADATKAKAGFAEAEKAADKFDVQLGNIAKTAVNAFATREIANFAKSAIGQASDLAESANAVDVAFEDAAGRILTLGENAAEAVGLSATDFNQFAVQFSGFARQLTTSEKDIVDVTEEISTRVADFASVMNLEVPDAASKFQSALSGSAEVLRPYGIDVSDAAVKQKLLTDNLWDGEGALTESEKVMGRYLTIMEQTEQMAGDFANTSDGLANSQRILKADFDNLKATVGEAMIPALENLMGAVKPVLEAFTTLPDGVQQVGILGLAAVGGTRAISNTIQGLGGSAKFANRMAFGLTGTMVGLTIALDHFATKQKEIDEAAQSMRDVLDENNNVFTDSAEKMLEFNIAGSDLDRDLETLGLTLGDLTSAAQGNEDAIEKVAEATKYATEIGDGFFDFMKTTTVGTEDQTTASLNVKRALEGYTEALEDAAYRQERLGELTEETDAETRRFMDIIESDNIYNFTEDVTEAATGMSELRKQTFKTNTELNRLFDRLDDEQALADFLEEVEDANEALRATEEGTPEYEQAIRDRMFALEDLIETHSLVDSAFGKELIPLINTGDIDALEAKIYEILGLIGTIAPDIQAAIDAGSIAAASVSQLATQPYAPGRTEQGRLAAQAGTIIEKVDVIMPAGSDGRDVADKLITFTKRNGAVPVANLPGVKY